MESGSRSETIVFVNPWQGIIGPNIGMQQLASEALSRGHRVHIVTRCRDELTERLERLGAKFHVMPGLEKIPRTHNPLAILRHLRRGWFVAWKVGQLAQEVSADVICVNGENMLLMPRAGRTAHCPVVAVVRGIRFAELGPVGRVFFSIQKRWASRYLAVSRSVRGELLKMGIGDEQISVVCNGVDTNLFRPGQPNPSLAGKLGISNENLVIGAVCHFTPRKGIHHLTETFGRLAPLVPNALCLLVGDVIESADKAYGKQLRQRVVDLGIADRVIFAGRRTDILDMMRLVDVLVHPSETESFGRTIVEAMACEKPVVGFRVGAVGELISDGLTGILIEPFDTEAMTDAVAGLLKDEALRRQMGQAGRERAVRLYDLKTNITAAVNLLEEIVGRR